MRIVMVGPFGLHVKGTMSVRALPLGRALARRGHEVRMILPPWDSPAASGRSEHEAGVEIDNVSLKGAWLPRASCRVARRLLCAAVGASPDVAHLFKPVGYTGVVGMSLMARRERPAVVFDLDDLEGRSGWGSLASRWPGEARLREWQEQWALRHADGLTVASRHLLEMALSAGMPAQRVVYAPNGCDAPLVPIAGPCWARTRCETRLRYGIEEEAPLVLWSTRFTEVDCALVIRMLEQLARACPSIRILIAGAPRAGTTLEHELQIPLSLRNRVRQVDWLPLDDWRRAALAADVGIVPLDDSLINRARCPAKLPLMLALGLPVVAHDLGEVPTYVIEGQTGRRIAPDDDAGFVAAVLDLLTQRIHPAMEPAQISRQTLDAYGWDKLAASVELAYRRSLVYKRCG